MKCKGCGETLDDYCLDCQKEMLDKAFAKAWQARRKKGRGGIVLFEDDPMYTAVLARRDLEARTLESKQEG